MLLAAQWQSSTRNQVAWDDKTATRTEGKFHGFRIRRSSAFSWQVWITYHSAQTDTQFQTLPHLFSAPLLLSAESYTACLPTYNNYQYFRKESQNNIPTIGFCMLFSNFRSTPYLCCVSVHGWVNKTNLTTGLPKSYDIYQLWCLTPACPCHKVLKQKLTVRLLIRSFTRGSNDSGSRLQRMSLAIKDKRQRKPSRGKQRHKLTLPDCELEGLLLPPVSQISKLHTLLSHGPAWANPPGNAGQSGLGGIRARLLPVTAMPTWKMGQLYQMWMWGAQVTPGFELLSFQHLPTDRGTRPAESSGFKTSTLQLH